MIMGSPIYHSCYRCCKVVRLFSVLATLLVAATHPSISAAGQQLSEQDQVIAKVRLQLQTGHAAEAVPELHSYLAANPDSAQATYLLGYAYYSLHEARLSLEQYTRGAQLRAPSAADLFAVSADYILLEDYADAAKWLTQVTALEPDNALAWYYLGRSLFFQQDYTAAARAYANAFEHKSEFVRAEVGQGLVEEATGKPDEAMRSYLTAQTWDQHSGNQDAQPYISAGELQLKQNQLTQALASMIEARSISRTNPRVLEDLGRIYERLGRYAEAETTLHEAESLAPDASTLHFLRGRALQHLGRKTDAEAEFERTQQILAAHSNKATENFDLQP
jgi:tetratricopeptide (TPR) repeat protein